MITLDIMTYDIIKSRGELVFGLPGKYRGGARERTSPTTRDATYNNIMYLYIILLICDQWIISIPSTRRASLIHTRIRMVCYYSCVRAVYTVRIAHPYVQQHLEHGGSVYLYIYYKYAIGSEKKIKNYFTKIVPKRTRHGSLIIAANRRRARRFCPSRGWAFR